MTQEFRLNRLLSGPLTAVLLKTILTPNQITLISLGFGLFAGYLLSLGTYTMSLAGALSYQMAIVLDNCDGEVARAKNMRSVLGGWLDVIADVCTDAALFSGIAVGLLRQNVQAPVRLFWALCLSGALIHFTLVILEKLKGFGPAVHDAPHPEHEQRKKWWLTLFDALREGDASWFVLLFCAIGQTAFLLVAGGLYMQALWIAAVLINFRWLFR